MEWAAPAGPAERGFLQHRHQGWQRGFSKRKYRLSDYKKAERCRYTSGVSRQLYGFIWYVGRRRRKSFFVHLFFCPIKAFNVQRSLSNSRIEYSVPTCCFFRGGEGALERNKVRGISAGRPTHGAMSNCFSINCNCSLLFRCFFFSKEFSLR